MQIMNSLYPNNCLKNSLFKDSKLAFDIGNEKNYLMKDKVFKRY